MAPHQHLLQLTLQPAFSSRTLRPHNIKHSALSHSSHYLILTHCFHLVSENGKGDPRSNDTEVIKHHNIFFFFEGGRAPVPNCCRSRVIGVFFPWNSPRRIWNKSQYFQKPQLEKRMQLIKSASRSGKKQLCITSHNEACGGRGWPPFFGLLKLP